MIQGSPPVAGYFFPFFFLETVLHFAFFFSRHHSRGDRPAVPAFSLDVAVCRFFIVLFGDASLLVKPFFFFLIQRFFPEY